MSSSGIRRVCTSSAPSARLPNASARAGSNGRPICSIRHGRRLPAPPRLTVNTVDGVLAAAEAGLGIANLLSYQLAEAIDAGRLIALLEGEQPPELPVHLLFEPSRAALPAVRLFIEAIRARMRMAGLG